MDAPPIYDGETMTDRKSKFQAHLAPVTNKEQVYHSASVFRPNPTPQILVFGFFLVYCAANLSQGYQIVTQVHNRLF